MRATIHPRLTRKYTAFKTLYDKHMRSPIACLLANNSDNPELVNPSTLYNPREPQGLEFR